MNILISNHLPDPTLKQYETESNNSFNELVLSYIKDNKPEGELVQLLTIMKNLSPADPVTMQKLSSALLYSDTTLRSDPDYVNYTSNILDSRTSQMLSLSMLTNIMLNNISRHYDEDEN